MTKHVLSILLLISACCAFGQSTREVDSLLHILNKGRSDSLKVSALLTLGRLYYESDNVTAEKYYRQALDLSEKSGFKWGSAGALNNLGNITSDKGDYGKALDYYQEALAIREQLKDSSRIAIAHNNIGITYMDQGNFGKATEYLFNALHIAELISDTNVIAMAQSNLGIVYQKQLNYSKSLEFYKKALDTRQKQGDIKSIATIYNNLGVVHERTGQFETALEYYEKALKIAREIRHFYRIAAYLDNMGNTYRSLKKYDAGLRCNLEALRIRDSINDKTGIVNSCINASNGYVVLKDYANAEKLLQRSLTLSREIGVRFQEKESYKGLADLYAAKGEHQKALDYFRQYSDLKDTIFNEDLSKQMTEMAARYETEKNQKENEFLKKEATLKDEQIQKDQTIKSYLYGFVGLILALAFVLYYAYNNKRKSNLLLTAQKNQIEAQKKEIIDSIHYAKRIQQSLLPTEKYIDRNLKRHEKGS